MFNLVSLKTFFLCVFAKLLHNQYCVLLSGVVSLQMQDFAFPFGKLHDVPVCPFLQPVEVPLHGSTIIWCINCSSQFRIICRLAEDAL